MKRSRAVSLILLAGAGVAAVAIAKRDPSQQEEDALIYRSERECMDARQRPDDCRSQFRAAQAAYAGTAPRYQSQADCEAHHDEGPYGAEGYVRQALASLPHQEGNYAVIGSWIVGDDAAGICIRESASPITTNASRFVPHVILG